MKKLLLILALLTIPAFSQGILPATAYRVTSGNGVPPAGTCNTASNVGKVYARKDAAAASSTFYVCSNTASMTYGWELGQGGGGTGCNPAGTAGQLITSNGASSCTSQAQFVITANALALGATGSIDASAASVTGGLKLPSSAGAAPLADGFIAVDTTAHTLKFGSNGSSKTVVDTGVSTLSSLTSVGTIATGTWNATAISNVKGGTGGDSSAASGIAHISTGTWTYSAIVNADITNGTITSAKLVGTDITTVGTIATGTWSATAIALNKGGTGQTTQQAAYDAIAPTATRAGDLTYWNGTHYVNLAGNNVGSTCLGESSSGVPSWVSCGTGGSVFTSSTATAPAFSATPTFSLADVSVKSPLRVQPGALTADVTSVTFTNKTAGAKFSIAWLQDGTGGRTVTYGASASNTCTISATASKTTTQQFEVAADGTTVLGTGCTSDDAADTPITIISGDGTTPGSGSGVLTITKVNGVSSAASPATDSVQVVTASNTRTDKVIPDCPTSALGYTQSTHAFGCNALSSGGAGFSGSVSLGTSAISSGACATVVTSTQTGMASTDSLAWAFNADPTAVTGYSPSTSGMLAVIAYPTTDTANFKICNNTASSITPGAITLNFAASRGAIASGTSALGTSAIGSGACATAVTTAATGAASTSTITGSFNGDPTAVTGYSPTTNGMLTIIGYPTSGNVNWKVCNNTTASITPGAITLNWRVF